MKAVVRRLAYAALGLAFTRVVAGAALGRRSAGALGGLPRPFDTTAPDVANLALLGALAATAVAAGGLGAATPATALSHRDRRALRAAAIAGSALSLANAAGEAGGRSAVGVASGALLLPASLALVVAARRADGTLRTSSRVAAGTVGLHLVTGLALRALDMPDTLRAAHAGLGALAWLSMVAAAALALRVPAAVAAETLSSQVALDDASLEAAVESGVVTLPVPMAASAAYEVDVDEEPVVAMSAEVAATELVGVEIAAAAVIAPEIAASDLDAEAAAPPVTPTPPRRPPTLAVLLARGADF